MQNITFPHYLRKLSLNGTGLCWEDMATKIGLLPRLEALKLGRDSFKGPEWKTVEGEFPSLKLSKIHDIYSDLECWTTDSFPRLEHIFLQGLNALEKIPSSIGDIPTLLSIQLRYCSYSAVISAKRIAKEQEELGNTSLQVEVWGPNVESSESEDDSSVMQAPMIATLGVSNSAAASSVAVDRSSPVIALNGDGRFLPDPISRTSVEPEKVTEVNEQSQLHCLRLPDSLLSERIIRLIYTNSGDSILALAYNAVHKLWKWQRSDRNLTGRQALLCHQYFGNLLVES